MAGSFFMQMDETVTLNFLIYIQNLYLNQKENPERPRFPYSPQPILFADDFEVHFCELWKEAEQRIAEAAASDTAMFYEERDVICRRLFQEDSRTVNNFYGIGKSFEAWWNSMIGCFSLERCVHERSDKLYRDLADFLVEEEMEPERYLHISLLYDACRIGEVGRFPYFALVPVEDFYLRYEAVADNLKKCML